MKRRKFRKANNDLLTVSMLEKRTAALAAAGWQKPKWIEFSESLIACGFRVHLYEARRTRSKYLTVSLGKLPEYKVRFSNHAPIKTREERGDCDFFVGRTNFAVTTTLDAMVAVKNHFKAQAELMAQQPVKNKQEGVSDGNGIAIQG